MIVNYRGDIPLDDLSWLPFDRMPGVTAMLTDVRWLEGARAMLTAARAANVTAVLDADIGEPAIVSELVPLAGHAIFSEPGLHGWCGHYDVDRALRAAVAAGAGMAGVTLGERGTTLLLDEKLYPRPRIRHHRRRHAGRRRRVFMAPIRWALAEGGRSPMPPAASVAAAIKCTRHGGRQGCPSGSR
jgi:sugar/nucleoside kinase (ribokinase family)